MQHARGETTIRPSHGTCCSATHCNAVIPRTMQLPWPLCQYAHRRHAEAKPTTETLISLWRARHSRRHLVMQAQRNPHAQPPRQTSALPGHDHSITRSLALPCLVANLPPSTLVDPARRMLHILTTDRNPTELPGHHGRGERTALGQGSATPCKVTLSDHGCDRLRRARARGRRTRRLKP